MAGLPNSGDLRLPSSPSEINLKQLLHDAQSRWLKPAEVSEILNNHHNLPLSEAAPVKPTSGSLFLFDRNKLRYFRKDGHCWRKKKDAKTVREAHEKLKVGNRDAIHCYYAHGEDNPNFQRRSYWLLEGGYEHIVLVHYREVTEGSRYEALPPAFEENAEQYYPPLQPTNMIYGSTSDYLTSTLISSPSEMGSSSYNSQGGVIDANSGDEFEDIQMTGERRSQAYQASVLDRFNAELGLDSTESPDYAPHSANPIGSTSAINDVSRFQTAASSQDSYGHESYSNDLEGGLDASTWSTLLESTYTAEDNSVGWTGLSQLQQSTTEKDLQFTTSTYQGYVTSREEQVYTGQGAGSAEPWSSNSIKNHQLEAGYAADQQPVGQEFTAKPGEVQTINSGLMSPTVSLFMESIQSYPANLAERCAGSTWIDGGLVPSDRILLGSDTSWGDAIRDCNAVSEASSLQEQSHSSTAPDPQGLLFSIVDFAPQWSYAFEETKVLVTGFFLDPSRNNSNTRWSCMFGEIEVPAEVLQSGALRCTAPASEPGRVRFYVTCSDRVACSKIEEFEFRNKSSVSPRNLDADTNSKQQEQVMLLQVRLAEFLLAREDKAFAGEASNDSETTQKQNDKLDMLVVDENIWSQIEALVKGSQHPFADAKATLVEAFFKSALHQWLQRRQHGKGVSLLDKHGVGVLHMAAALGYEWAIAPILAAGVGINFRDERGWTALHWAAFCGREKVIALLLAADAAPGALTDPTPSDRNGRTASDLAATSGHNGIAGYLGEAIVTSHLSSLSLQESKMSKVVVADQPIEVVSEKSTVVDASLGMSDDALSLRDSLAAVRNAAQAEARITATFRAYSFLKKREMEGSTLDEFGVLEEEARAFAAAQTSQRAYPGHEKSNLAATQIQCKYRGWKARSDFLSLKKQVVKIQAHVRGHQARKKYKKVLWTVGILDKVILRWRRKGSGLRGFKAEGVEDEDSDDDAYLKDFRKQKEAVFADAVSKVKLMIQNPEARSQYRRMLEIYQKEKGAQLGDELIIPDDDELMGLLG